MGVIVGVHIDKAWRYNSATDIDLVIAFPLNRAKGGDTSFCDRHIPFNRGTACAIHYHCIAQNKIHRIAPPLPYP